VRYGYVQLRRSERAGNSRVRVSVKEHPVRTLGQEHGFEASNHRGSLLAVQPGADLEIVRRVSNGQIAEERAAHRVVVMLTGVDDPMLNAGVRRKHPIHHGELYELRPGANDRGDPHVTGKRP
jgi:hypothetical protein